MFFNVLRSQINAALRVNLEMPNRSLPPDSTFFTLRRKIKDFSNNGKSLPTNEVEVTRCWDKISSNVPLQQSVSC